MFKAKIYVHLKKSVFDPQGDTVLHSLHAMDFQKTTGVRVGKYLEVDLEMTDKAAAEKDIRQMCDQLLVNPVIEDYSYELIPL